MSSQTCHSRNAALHVLGLSEGATDQAIHSAYRKAILRTHPDKPGGSDAAFLNVQEAYRLIKETVDATPADATFDAKVDTAFEDLIASIFKNVTVTVTTHQKAAPPTTTHQKAAQPTTSHQKATPKCRFWNGTHGSCRNGDNCTFRHPTSMCNHYNRPGGCKYGDKCNNLHTPHF